jgi:hypothetical protein
MATDMAGAHDFPQPRGLPGASIGRWQNRCRYAAGMIDFQSGGLLARLGPSDPRAIAAELAAILVDGEAVYLSFKGVRDSVVFTNKRLITVNVQGLTGKKRDYSSLPSRGLGNVRLDFKGQVDIRTIGQLIGQHVL